jgi:hypothetical protein
VSVCSNAGAEMHSATPVFNLFVSFHTEAISLQLCTPKVVVGVYFKVNTVYKLYLEYIK